jgi:GABA(A) receptor-associated protein
MSYSFKECNGLEKRLKEFSRIKEKHPDRYPVIVEKFTGEKNLEFFAKNKYIVTGDTTVGQLMYMVRRNIALRPHISLFIFINNILPPANMQIGDLYDMHKDEDGFLYTVVTCEGTFGNIHNKRGNPLGQNTLFQ